MAKNLSQLESEDVGRMSLTWEELDWAYGVYAAWGAPLSRISLWSGSQGVGKSRLLAEIMKRLAMTGRRSLIFQTEASANQFASEKFKGNKSDLIYISEEDKLDNICAALEKVKPRLVFIDSIQMIRCDNSYKDADQSKTQYIINQLRNSLEVAGGHLVLISQLNKAGTTKGSTELPHLVDIECFIKPWLYSLVKGKIFEFEVRKNRYGQSGRKVMFGHTNAGVECQSSHRLDDSEWQRWLDNRGHDIVTDVSESKSSDSPNPLFSFGNEDDEMVSKLEEADLNSYSTQESVVQPKKEEKQSDKKLNKSEFVPYKISDLTNNSNSKIITQDYVDKLNALKQQEAEEGSGLLSWIQKYILKHM